jgi:hypothetical protein
MCYDKSINAKAVMNNLIIPLRGVWKLGVIRQIITSRKYVDSNIGVSGSE